MRLKHLFRGYDYRARVHYSADDMDLVPLDSIQTDNFQELVDFILAKVNQGLSVQCHIPARDDDLIMSVLGAQDLTPVRGGWIIENNLLQPVEREA